MTEVIDESKQEIIRLVNRNTELENENKLMQLKLDALDGYIPWDKIADSSEQIKENLHLKQQLVKAKELLKRSYNNYIYLEPLRSEIEQFLKEADK